MYKSPYQTYARQEIQNTLGGNTNLIHSKCLPFSLLNINGY